MRLYKRSFGTSRVMTLVLIPVLALVGLCAFIATTTAESATTLARATTVRSTVVDPVGFYLIDLQGERILAATYLAAPTAPDPSALTAQESKTDAALAAVRTAAGSSGFQGAASPAVKTAMAATLQAGGGLPALRREILSRTVSRADAQAAYTNIIAGGLNTIAASVRQEPNVPLVIQSLDVLQVAVAQDVLLQSQALLVGDMAAGHFPAADHATFAQMVGMYRGLLTQAMAGMAPQYSAPYHRLVSASSLAALQANENTVINSPPGAVPAIHLTSYAQAASAVAGGLATLSFADAVTLSNALHQAAGPIDLRLILAGGLGLLAIVSVAVSAWIARRLLRQLAELRDDALELAHERLPRAMARLSAGEQLDVEVEAPPLAASSDEIGQVRQAFNSVQRSAIEAAVSQARLRAGISKIFRNVARRSQALLHQQLALLDALERRATEPAELEGLFRIDHLTTRMRRQAEGFVVLAGDRPGRTWTEPVPMADVLRGAVAEVVDYARIRVVCTSRAALQGRAVADVIHLIAELAENATVFSPPHTPVRIVGSPVVHGFAVEIEDRGLGMSQEKMAGFNAAFLDEPRLDFPESQQLGLYVAARLAQRHDIRVMLRSSPFGGTTAILLIPVKLVVSDAKDAAQDRAAGSEDQPGQGKSAPTGRHASRISVGEPRFGLPVGRSAGENGHAQQDAGMNGHGHGNAQRSTGVNGHVNGNGNGNGNAQRSTGVNGHAPQGAVEQRGAGTLADSGSWELPDWMYGSGSGPVKPHAEPVAAPEPPAPPPAGQRRPVQSWPLTTGSSGETDDFNLPQRVRQANLAPQLREPPYAQTAGNNRKRTAERSPDEIRDGLSAAQRGWERGRGDNSSAVEPGANPADGAKQPPLDPPAIGGTRGVGT
jgi:signal transduction histidine kinase